MYLIIWKYKIKPANREKFEDEYGSAGTWSVFFSQSSHYKGSFLYKSEEEENTYLLIDTWVDKQTYDDFRQTKAESYHQLSASLQYLYVTEEKTGTFTSVAQDT